MAYIKYRAWDYDNECMYDDSQIIIHEGTVFIGRIKFINQISQDTELMQYTSLRDRNGIEICEGDIITCKYDSGKNCFDDEYYQIVLSNCSFNMAKIDNEYDTVDFDEFMDLIDGAETVGNVYEHKHILEAIK